MERKQIIDKLKRQIDTTSRELGITKDEVMKRSSFRKPINNYSDAELEDTCRRIKVSLKLTKETKKI